MLRSDKELAMTTPVACVHEPRTALIDTAEREVWTRVRRIFKSTEVQILLAAAILFVVFSILYPDSFFSTGTFLNMARVAGILLVVSLGQSFAIIIGGFDISVGATMGFVSVIISLFMVDGGGVSLAVILGLISGLAVGLVNGLLIAGFGVAPFIATLGMLTFLRGLADQISNGTAIVGLPPALSLFGRGNWFGVPSAACLAAIVLLIAWLVLQRSRAGLYIFAIGGNREAARVAGVQVFVYEVLAYALCGLLAGMAGVMLTSRVAIGQATLGVGYELLSIATAVIGGVAIGGGVGRLSGVLLAVLLLTFLTTGLDIAGINSFYQQMVTGIVLVAAVLVSQLQKA
jgi:ribose/xylose/arabinose/galactoside ABC-type transport system permease subunit